MHGNSEAQEETLHAAVTGRVLGRRTGAAWSRVSLLKALQVSLRETNARRPELLIQPLELAPSGEYLGLAESLAAALEVCVELRMQLLSMGLESRHVLAGLLLMPGFDQRWIWSLGEGMDRAHRQLRTRHPSPGYALSLPGRRQLEVLSQALAGVISRIEAGWTERQLDCVIDVYSMPQLTRNRLAAELGVSRKSLFQVLRSARWGEHCQLRAALREALQLERRQVSPAPRRSCHSRRSACPPAWPC